MQCHVLDTTGTAYLIHGIPVPTLACVRKKTHIEKQVNSNLLYLPRVVLMLQAWRSTSDQSDMCKSNLLGMLIVFALLIVSLGNNIGGLRINCALCGMHFTLSWVVLAGPGGWRRGRFCRGPIKHSSLMPHPCQLPLPSTLSLPSCPMP